MEYEAEDAGKGEGVPELVLEPEPRGSETLLRVRSWMKKLLTYCRNSKLSSSDNLSIKGNMDIKNNLFELSGSISGCGIGFSRVFKSWDWNCDILVFFGRVEVE